MLRDLTSFSSLKKSSFLKKNAFFLTKILLCAAYNTWAINSNTDYSRTSGISCIKIHTSKNINLKIRHYTTCILVQTLSHACLLFVLNRGDSALLKQTGIQIAKNLCQINFAVSLNNQELKKLIIKIVDARGKFLGEIMYHLASYYLVQN